MLAAVRSGQIPPSDADDVIQDAAIRLMAQAARYDPAKASLNTYASMVCRATILDRGRRDRCRKRRTGTVEELHEGIVAGHGREDLDTDRLETLNPDDLDFFRVVVNAGYRGAAVALGVPIGTLKSKLNRMRDRIAWREPRQRRVA